MKINEQIAYLRREKGMTQEQLAAELGVTNQSVSKWESGQNCPDIQLLPEIARIFDVTIDSLMGCHKKDSLSELMLRIRDHMANTPADKAFESCYRVAALLHEAALTYGYNIDAHWNTGRDYATEAMDKWGLSLMNDDGSGCSGRNSRGIFFALAGGGEGLCRYQRREMAEKLAQIADPDVLGVMFELGRLGKDEWISKEELAERTEIDVSAVEMALYTLRAEANDGKYRLDERFRHFPALVSFMMPM